MFKSFKYRIYPGPGQRRKLEATLESCRWLYNFFLAERKYAWEGESRNIRRFDQCNEIIQLKKVNSNLEKVYSQVLQHISSRVDKSFKDFFRRIKTKDTPGYPRFKGKGHYTSFTYPQIEKCGVRHKDNKINLSKLGLIKIKFHRPLEGKPKTCIVHKSPTNKWYVTFQCECEEPTPLPKNALAVGIDLGLKTFTQLSDGEKIENPRFFRQEEKALAKAQRRLSKFEKKSTKRSKRKKVVSRVYERISFKRDNFCHQESRKLVNTYQVLCLEDLSVSKLIEQKKFSKAISDAAWTKFTLMLEVKAAWAGRQVVKVNPAYTSQECSQCGNRQKMPLSERTYKCPQCGLSMDRDLNASLNILRLGLQSLEGGLSPSLIEVH